MRRFIKEGHFMAYSSMSVTQKPFVINNNQGFIKKKEDEESSNSSRSSQTENDQPQINQNRRPQRGIQQELVDAKASQKAAIASRDANLKSATVNIAQILKDFKNTAKAIGASPELTEEVNAYLDLVTKQVQKENPDLKIVKSNLKNASFILDNYISETLQRPSKVVENWIDALFLQNIDYHFNEEDVNPQFLVKFPKHDKEKGEQESSEENSSEDDGEEKEDKNSQKTVIVPKDEELKSLFIKAKKFAYASNSKKAMEIFKQALDRAVEVQDKDTESKILFEIGKIYDKNDYLEQALTSYNQALIVSPDLSVKTRAHYSMAQIYDDIAQFEPAINHYMSSISYAGETENLAAQSTSLIKIGNMYSDKYNKEAFDYLLEADLLANETKDHKVKGFVSSHIANSYNRFNEPSHALKYYSNAIVEYDKADVPKKAAINYKRAAEVMHDFNNPKKAKALLQKALLKAKQSDDTMLMKEINELLSEV